jgi:hypothetical protein
MEMVLNNGFFEMTQDDMMCTVAGGWVDFALAAGGILCIAASPIVAASGVGIPAALVLAGTGCGLIGSI